MDVSNTRVIRNIDMEIYRYASIVRACLPACLRACVYAWRRDGDANISVDEEGGEALVAPA